MNKYFTMEQAEKSLVLVKPIVKDIMIKRKKMIDIKTRIKYLKEKKDVLKSGKILKIISKDITYNLEELEQIGCYLKDLELGIVDFPSIINNKVVFITWIVGDNKINFYHELTTNVSETKLITEKSL